MIRATSVSSPLTPTSDAPTRPARRDRGRRVYVLIAILSLLTVVIGFGRTTWARYAAGGPALSPLVMVHAIAFAGWVVVFTAQTVLVASRRVAVHRRLGIAGVALAAGMIVLGYATAIAAARHGYNPGGPFSDGIEFLVVPLFDLIVFGGFVTMAVLNRRRGDVHKRMMVLALVGGLVGAAITRLPYVTGRVPAIVGVTLVLLAIGPIADAVTRRRIHPVYLWGVPVAFLSVPLRIAIAHTGWWHSLATWLIL